MSSYLKQEDYLVRRQDEPLTEEQVKNSAGGYVWQLDMWGQAQRFLTLGSEGGTYYATQQKLTRENARNLEACINANGPKTVSMIAQMRNRVAKRDTIFFALAMCMAIGDNKTKEAVHLAFPTIVRTGADILHFTSYADSMRGWGRSMKRLVASWYGRFETDKLAYQLTKYQNRHTWTHKDVLSKCHYGANTPLMRWVTKREMDVRNVKRRKGGAHDYPAVGTLPEYVQGFMELRSGIPDGRVIELINQYGYTHEMIPNEYKDKPYIWEALLENMPVMAMVRNLGKMSAVGLLKPLSDGARKVTEKLNPEAIQKSLIHPINVLMAYLTYQSGHGVRGKLSWSPVPDVIDALDSAYYLAFGNVKATGKRTMIAVDVSSSMTWGTLAGCESLTPVVGAAAMAMVFARTEPNYYVVGFTGELRELGITSRDTLKAAISKCQDRAFGVTDCAQPMIHALERNLDVETFITITDNETWAGKMHPAEALNRYRNKKNPTAKSIVVAMTATGFTIADPNDAGMLDVVGFDSMTPQLVSQFSEGSI